LTSPCVLVITMGMDYVAPARMPFELQRAGFRVALLAPREALAAQTSYVDTIGHFPDGVKFKEWVGIVAGTVRAVNPALILPGEGPALRHPQRTGRLDPAVAGESGRLDGHDRQVVAVRACAP